MKVSVQGEAELIRSESVQAAFADHFEGFDEPDPPAEWVRRSGRPRTWPEEIAHLWHEALAARQLAAALALSNVQSNDNDPIGLEHWMGTSSIATAPNRWSSDRVALVAELCNELACHPRPLTREWVEVVVQVKKEHFASLAPIEALARSLRVSSASRDWLDALCFLADGLPFIPHPFVPAKSIATMRSMLVEKSDRVAVDDLAKELGLPVEVLAAAAEKASVPAFDASPFVSPTEAAAIRSVLPSRRRSPRADSSDRPGRAPRPEPMVHPPLRTEVLPIADHPEAVKYVVIDGTNLAIERDKRNAVPSHIESAVAAARRFFPNASVQVYVDRSWYHRFAPKPEGRRLGGEDEARLLSNQLSDSSWVVAPAGTRGKADGAVLRAATKVGGIVISNDQYREHHSRYPWLLDQPGRVWVAFMSFGEWAFEVADIQPDEHRRADSS